MKKHDTLQILFIRHAETDYEDIGDRDPSDGELTAKGERQCVELGEKLISFAEEALSTYEKRIFSMYLEGQHAKEISCVIGKSEKSVNNAIYRIRVKLKKTVK